ncbi:hypothetical protein EDB19DRAFT_1776035 [Suillus lakei]|nr:hypothetical protein EDB19DRAFT_1776035 [Suillus lakei]
MDTNTPQCYNSQLKPSYHGNGQRYTSPTNGKCKRLIVQSVDPKLIDTWEERNLSSKIPPSTKLAAWLINTIINPSRDVFLWLFVWPVYIFALLMPSRNPAFSHFYRPYLMRFVGHLWAARSQREYSLRSQPGEDVRCRTHALFPRFLIAVIKQKPYIAITYCYSDMMQSGNGAEVLIQRSQDATLGQGFDASRTEKAQDLYRMSDVYRRASFTLIMLSDEKGWAAWGGPLLSHELRYKAGENAVTPIKLFQLAALAYSHAYHNEESQITNSWDVLEKDRDLQLKEESQIINFFALGKDPLERLDRNLQLKEAIWRRFSSPAEERYRAEKVYALMGFFEHRILPDAAETELQALARLFMANDNDRIADRMISMFPRDKKAMNQWYTKEDEYGAKLWDIEPAVQVIGVTSNGALVLDGCRAAAIRWKNFPHVAFATRRSIRRLLALAWPYLAWFLIVVGIPLLATGNQGENTTNMSLCLVNGSYTLCDTKNTGELPQAAAGIAMLVIAIVLLLFAPFLTTYGHSGQVVLARPWLIGVRGVISAQQASKYLYGVQLGDSRRTFYTPSGSLLAKPTKDDSKFREGHVSQYEAALAAPPFDPIEGHMFTLVDTVSGTIYYFRAHRPPTVCLFTGTEGGQGRFVLCSGKCSSSELVRETVLRMPSYISTHMNACDWVALCGEA